MKARRAKKTTENIIQLRLPSSRKVILRHHRLSLWISLVKKWLIWTLLITNQKNTWWKISVKDWFVGNLVSNKNKLHSYVDHTETINNDKSSFINFARKRDKAWPDLNWTILLPNYEKIPESTFKSTNERVGCNTFLSTWSSSSSWVSNNFSCVLLLIMLDDYLNGFIIYDIKY